MPLNTAASRLWFRGSLHVLLTAGLTAAATALVIRRLAAQPGDLHARASLAHLLAEQGQHAAAA